MKLFTKTIILALLVSACQSFGGGDAQQADVIFNSPSSGTLFINNGSDEDVVLFRDQVSKRNLMGGVRSLEQGHRIDSLGEGYFVVQVVAYDDYLANRDNLTDKTVRIVNSVEALVNEKESTVTVGSFLKGEGRIAFRNRLTNFVEIHDGSWNGPVVITLHPEEYREVSIEPKAFDFFPVVRVTEKAGDKIVNMWGQNYGNAASSFQVKRESVTEFVIDKGFQASWSRASLTVTNNTGTGLRFYDGATKMISTVNYEVLNQGDTYGYSVEGGKLFTSLLLRPLSGDDLKIPETRLENGRNYNIIANRDGSVDIDAEGEELRSGDEA